MKRVFYFTLIFVLLSTTAVVAKSKGGVEYPQESVLVPLNQSGDITPQHYTTCVGKTDVYRPSTSVIASYGYTQCTDKQERISVLNTLYRNNAYLSSDNDVLSNSSTAYAEGGSTTYYSSYTYRSDSHHNSTHDGVTSGTYTADSSY